MQFYYKYIRKVRAFADLGNLPDFRPLGRIFCRSNSIKTAICDHISKHYKDFKGLIIVNN